MQSIWCGCAIPGPCVLASLDQRAFEFVKILMCIIYFYPKYLVKWGHLGPYENSVYIIDKIVGKISTNFSRPETQQVFTATQASCSFCRENMVLELKCLCKTCRRLVIQEIVK